MATTIANATVLARTCPDPTRLLLLYPAERSFISRWEQVTGDTEIRFRHYAGSVSQPRCLFTFLLLRNSCGSYGDLLKQALEMWTWDKFSDQLQPYRCLALPWPYHTADTEVSEAQLLCYCMRRSIYFDLGFNTLGSAEEMKSIEGMCNTKALHWAEAALGLFDLGLFYLPLK
jgi:hypothetical protein